jgi:branched-chain amino acid transport system permease protein
MSQSVIEAAETRLPLSRRDLTEKIVMWLLIAGLALWLVLSCVNHPQQFAEAGVVGVSNGALYALIALGYTLVYGIIELINFSHGDLFMLSTVLSGFFVITWFHKTTATVGSFLVVFAGLLIVMAFGAGLNTAAERLAYRQLRRAPKLAPMITAVGLSFAYQWGGIKSNGSGQKNWNTVLGNDGFQIGGVDVHWTTLIVIGATAPLLALMTWIVQGTRMGKAMRATAQDQDAARLMGIDVNRTIAFTFAMGGALAGAAGMLWLESVGNTRYDAGFRLGLYAFTAAVLGGIGNLTGAVIGGFLIGLIESFNASLGLGSQWSNTAVFTILILLMVFKPEGLLGQVTTEKV